MASVDVSAWPDLTLSRWADTRDTLHLWTQIAGKVRMALAPMVNHWWHVTLYVSARGLTTSTMPAGDRGVELEFDFLDDVLVVRTSDGQRRTVALQPRSVASFYAAVMAALDDVGVHVSIYPRPQEVMVAIPFPEDVAERAYDAGAARRFWQALLQTHRLLTQFRSGFIGKASPVHFFWGGADMAATRFSGRPAPRHPGGVPNCPDWVQELAYSHELSSAGFWPGAGGEGAFYAYAYPEPEGFGGWPVAAPAYYDAAMREFLLPYAEVRRSPDPDRTVLNFLQSTYEAAAELGHWDRAALEAAPAPPAR
ncbi:MAG TPA: DUF5996 family protein [Candidatus Dormibacteraeota bacterium]|jgi:hypothetical protein|nr:DUF5996 family protein [Candidatus Dormibacteraeota bacterium]